MLAKIVTETTDAVAAAVQGVDNILGAVTNTVKTRLKPLLLLPMAP